MKIGAKAVAHAVAKWAGISPPGLVMAVRLADLLRWRLSPRHFNFWMGWDRAIMLSIGGGWAVHLGNPG